MALSAAVRELISRAVVRFGASPSNGLHSLLWASFITAIIAIPWLGPGYIFGTDWPGPRRIDLPAALSSWAPLEVVLAAFSWVLGGELTGKVLILAFLFGAAWTSYLAAPVGGFIARAAASSVYVLNPFVYGRLHYGHVFLLAGYAVLPWTATRLRSLLQEPRAFTALMAGASLVLLGVLSLHLILVAAVLVGAMLITFSVGARRKRVHLERMARYSLLMVGVTLAGCAYWVIPLLAGQGPEGTKIAGIGNGDLLTFAAVPDRQLGLTANLLGLYGFWAENSGRFASMKAFVPQWPAVLSILLLVCAIGAVVVFRQREDGRVAWVAGLLVCSLTALTLEMGVSHPWTAGLVTWLDAHFVVYRGMRDAGKWAALLALVYSQLVAIGASAILKWLHPRIQGAIQREWAVSVASGLLLALPLYYGNGLLFGAHGEIRPSQYPQGWYAADAVLAADRHPDLTLFLPWHEYMSYSFVRNQNNVVAPPAPTFFSVPVLVSSNPEVPGVAGPPSRDQDAISGLVLAGSSAPWADILAAHHIKYVLLAHELNWKSFQFLDNQPNLAKIADYGSIALYRNLLVG
jgi:hypothetical protein